MTAPRRLDADGPWFIDEATDHALADLTLALPAMDPPADLLGKIEARIAKEAVPAAGVLVELAAAGRWRRIAPGVSMKSLWPRAFLLRCEPGAVAPDHEHPSVEHAVVILGDLVSEHGTFGPGDYHQTPAGARHQPWTTRTGCVVLVQYAA
jgi:anti-sigma factor ChrR (cupin superfamily)